MNYNDVHYSFGMFQPGRSYSSNSYRYGYQGSEKVDEVAGSGNSYTTYFRGLDPRIARWKSIDPKASAGWSPYTSMQGNPIMYNDILGDTIGNPNYNNVKLVVDDLNGIYSEKYGDNDYFFVGEYERTVDGETEISYVIWPNTDFEQECFWSWRDNGPEAEAMYDFLTEPVFSKLYFYDEPGHISESDLGRSHGVDAIDYPWPFGDNFDNFKRLGLDNDLASYSENPGMHTYGSIFIHEALYHKTHFGKQLYNQFNNNKTGAAAAYLYNFYNLPTPTDNMKSYHRGGSAKNVHDSHKVYDMSSVKK